MQNYALFATLSFKYSNKNRFHEEGAAVVEIDDNSTTIQGTLIDFTFSVLFSCVYINLKL